mgnify:FL=1
MIGIIGTITAAIAAYAGTPFREVKGFGVQCSNATPTLISNGAGGYSTVRCSAAMGASTGVYIGDNNINNTPSAMFSGYKICTESSCTDSAITLDASQVAYCISADPAAPTILNCVSAK